MTRCSICGHNCLPPFSADNWRMAMSASKLLARISAFYRHHFWLACTMKTFTIDGRGPTCQTRRALWGQSRSVSLITPWFCKSKRHLVNEDIIGARTSSKAGVDADFATSENVILGSFSGSTWRVLLESMYAFLRSLLSIPSLPTLDFGHEPRLRVEAHAILTPESVDDCADHPVLKIIKITLLQKAK